MSKSTAGLLVNCARLPQIAAQKYFSFELIERRQDKEDKPGLRRTDTAHRQKPSR